MQGVRYFKNENFPPLTQKMIVTLLSCLELQNKNISFGPTSIKGSLTTLIVRGLIVIKKITSTNHTEYKWEVTNEAITKLKELGIKL
jgi:hypothetical protein